MKSDWNRVALNPISVSSQEEERTLRVIETGKKAMDWMEDWSYVSVSPGKAKMLPRGKEGSSPGLRGREALPMP